MGEGGKDYNIFFRFCYFFTLTVHVTLIHMDQMVHTWYVLMKGAIL
jgi:hypothetical protein